MFKGKKIIVMLLALVAVAAVSSTTCLAASYGDDFWNGYTTTQDVYVSTNGYIDMSNSVASYRREPSDEWETGAAFIAYGLKDGVQIDSNWETYAGTNHRFNNDSGSRGRGKLFFKNDVSGFHEEYWILNAGTFS